MNFVEISFAKRASSAPGIRRRVRIPARAAPARFRGLTTLVSDLDDLMKRDAKHVVHPYTVMAKPAETYPITSADGATLTLEDGRVLVDGMSSWWAAVHGYANPVLDQAIRSQLDKMSHVMFVRFFSSQK